MGIKIKITGKEVEEITLGKEEIKNFNFIFDSPDDVKEKSIVPIIGIEFNGKINVNNKDEILKLVNWALYFGGQDIYRKVEIRLIDKEENILREYVFNKMFVVDYTENFEEENTTLGYEIKLTQKLTEKEEIKIFA